MIRVENIELNQGAFTLRNVSFEIPTNCYTVLMGKTGCGKTSLLEAIAGLRPIRSGRIVVRDVDVTHQPPAARQVGYVPQDGALFRTMTVFENLAFSLRVRRRPFNEIDARVRELAAWLHIEPLLPRIAVGLSGGETQRIALGRALAFGPRVLLMDEPLSSLDEDTRETLIEVLRSLRRQYPTTVLHVSHNRAEAEALGDCILRLQDGIIHA